MPSFYFGYELVKQKKFNKNANKYVAYTSNYDGNFLMKSSIDARKKRVELIFGGDELTVDQKQDIQALGKDFGLIEENVIIK